MFQTSMLPLSGAIRARYAQGSAEPTKSNFFFFDPNQGILDDSRSFQIKSGDCSAVSFLANRCTYGYLRRSWFIPIFNMDCTEKVKSQRAFRVLDTYDGIMSKLLLATCGINIPWTTIDSWRRSIMKQLVNDYSGFTKSHKKWCKANAKLQFENRFSWGKPVEDRNDQHFMYEAYWLIRQKFQFQTADCIGRLSCLFNARCMSWPDAKMQSEALKDFLKVITLEYKDDPVPPSWKETGDYIRHARSTERYRKMRECWKKHFSCINKRKVGNLNFCTTSSYDSTVADGGKLAELAAVFKEVQAFGPDHEYLMLDGSKSNGSTMSIGEKIHSVLLERFLLEPDKYLQVKTCIIPELGVKSRIATINHFMVAEILQPLSKYGIAFLKEHPILSGGLSAGRAPWEFLKGITSNEAQYNAIRCGFNKMFCTDYKTSTDYPKSLNVAQTLLSFFDEIGIEPYYTNVCVSALCVQREIFDKDIVLGKKKRGSFMGDPLTKVFLTLEGFWAYTHMEDTLHAEISGDNMVVWGKKPDTYRSVIERYTSFKISDDDTYVGQWADYCEFRVRSPTHRWELWQNARKLGFKACNFADYPRPRLLIESGRKDLISSTPEGKLSQIAKEFRWCTTSGHPACQLYELAQIIQIKKLSVSSISMLPDSLGGHNLWLSESNFSWVKQSSDFKSVANFAIDMIRSGDFSYAQILCAMPQSMMRKHSKSEEFFVNIAPLMEWIEAKQDLKEDKVLDRNASGPVRIDSLMAKMPGLVTTQQIATRLYVMKDVFEAFGLPSPFSELTPKGIIPINENELDYSVVKYDKFKELYDKIYLLQPRSSVYNERVLDRINLISGMLKVSLDYHLVNPLTREKLVHTMDHRFNEYIDWLNAGQTNKVNWVSLPRSLLSDDEILRQALLAGQIDFDTVVYTDDRRLGKNLVNEGFMRMKFRTYSETIFNGWVNYDTELSKLTVFVDEGSMEAMDASSVDGVYEPELGELLPHVLGLYRSDIDLEDFITRITGSRESPEYGRITTTDQLDQLLQYLRDYAAVKTG